jgi:FkbM family methyltransferase
MTDQFLQQINSLLSEPLSCVRERERSAFDALLAGCGNRIVLSGAGNLGRKVLQCLRTIGVEPLAFSDNSVSKWGTEVDGIRVLSSQDAAARFGDSALFVVTIWSLGQFYPETRAKLERLGCRQVASTATLRWKFADQLLPDFCQDLPHKLYKDAAEVRRAAVLWSDEYSRQEYLNQLKWRALGDQDALRSPVAEDSYFLDSLYQIATGEVFVDCGAYDGDTARQLIGRNPKFSRIFAIDADPANFRRLIQWMNSLDVETAPRISALNVAVGATRGRLSFRATGAEGARLAADGDITVDCLPIDELMDGSAPTFIKMDIEGAELDALAGAQHSIRAHQPILSICLYHQQDHLWRIPLFIHSLVPDYRFFLRPHDVDGWQLVCYAIPPSRLRS